MDDHPLDQLMRGLLKMYIINNFLVILVIYGKRK